MGIDLPIFTVNENQISLAIMRSKVTLDKGFFYIKIYKISMAMTLLKKGVYSNQTNNAIQL